jgi:hypothetical protein
MLRFYMGLSSVSSSSSDLVVGANGEFGENGDNGENENCVEFTDPGSSTPNPRVVSRE